MLILGAAALLMVSGIGALCFNRSDKLANILGASGAVLAGFGGLVLLCVPSTYTSATFPWPVPCGSLAIGVDPLGAVFLFPLFIVSALCALYGIPCLKAYFGKKNIGSAWFFFNLLITSMLLVLTARNVVLFLSAWETMAVSSFFLLMFEGEKETVRKAGFIYLVAAHVGTAFLLVMFLLLGQHNGSFDFADFKATLPAAQGSVIFILAVIGFGTKAGLVPLHIWLPEAHAAAPSHVSALMSGVMIKTGIYGLLRVLTFLGVPPDWWGELLIAAGIISGIFGILFALCQHDLKRLLAYSSIENMGIIMTAAGLGVLGMSLGDPVLTVCGFAAAFLHVINHALFKGLLFLGAGAVLHASGTRDINQLGGLLKRMPVTGFCFLAGAVAISGLPPLNGFFSEFLIYYSAFTVSLGSSLTALTALSVIAALALIGGLAAACFAKAFGIVFLGESRSGSCDLSAEPGMCMQLPLMILAAGCAAVAVAAPSLVMLLAKPLGAMTGMAAVSVQAGLGAAVVPLKNIVIVCLVFFSGVAVIVFLRRALLKERAVGRVLTWDCGYARPTARMQYTASAFVQPLIETFKGVVRPREHKPDLGGYFPGNVFFRTEIPDIFQSTVYRFSFRLIQRLTRKATWVQHGRLQLYILYIFLSLLALLVWKL